MITTLVVLIIVAAMLFAVTIVFGIRAFRKLRAEELSYIPKVRTIRLSADYSEALFVFESHFVKQKGNRKKPTPSVAGRTPHLPLVEAYTNEFLYTKTCI